MKKSLVTILGLLLVTSFSAQSFEYEAPKLEIAQWDIAGDGKTPTFLQYLDIQGVDAKEATHLVSATSKGDAVYSYALDLPPAILKPSLSLSYSSEGGVGLEMPYGWDLRGILEIRRPLVRAFETKPKAEWHDAEWLISGPDFSGTLKPDGEDNYRFVMMSASPVYVSAQYDISSNSWTVYSGGLQYTLQEQDNGEDSTDGTALWRVTEIQDGSGNYVTYRYSDDGRIQNISYGGNKNTGEDHLITVAFAYAQNTSVRTNARAGFLTEYRCHVDKITVQKGNNASFNDACATGISNLKQTTPDIQKAPQIGNSAIQTSKLSNNSKSEKSGMTKTTQTDPIKTDNIQKTSPVKDASGKLSTSQKAVPLTQTKSGTKTTAKQKSSGAPLSQIESAEISKDLSGAVNFNDATPLDADDEEDATNRLYAFDLVSESRDSTDFLVKIEREGRTSASAETIATFEYTEFQASSSAARTSSSGPSSLGASKGGSSGENKPTTSTTTIALTDFNRDGLPDVVDSKNKSTWKVKSQKVDYASRNFSWNSSATVNADMANTLGEVYTEAVDRLSASTRAYTKGQFVDFNGDGYPDFLYSTSESAWRVYYGNANHNLTTTASNYSTEKPPAGWKYSQLSYSVNADHHYAEGETVDVYSGTLDFNGDGWLDLYIPEEKKVWLHTGVKGGGWQEPIEVSYSFGAIRNVNYTIEADTFRIDSQKACEAACEEGCSEIDGDTDDCEDECLDEYDSDTVCNDLQDCEDECLSTYEDCLDDGTDLYRDCQQEDDCEYDDGGYDESCIESCCEGKREECEEDCSEQFNCDDTRADEDECRENCGNLNEDAMDECTSDCTSECSDESQLSNYIAATDEWAGFYDINGDGLPDHVNAAQTPWKVYLNNGHNFEAPVEWAAPVTYIRRSDEGRPEINWEYDEDDYKISEHDGGDPAKVNQILIDVDGDGLLDLALGKVLGDVWYKNTGSGFETEPRNIPGWWPDSFVTSKSTSDVDGDAGTSVSTGSTTSMVMDFDNDGALDYVTPTKISYGDFPKPYILKTVKNGQGGNTIVSYRSLATVTPSGDWNKPQYTHLPKHLVDVLNSVDTITQQNAATDFAYADGAYYEGVFEGFKNRDVNRYINHKWTSKTSYLYERSVHFEPLVREQKLYADGNLSFGSKIKRGSSPAEKLRSKVETEFGEYDSGEGTSFYLPNQRKVTEYGESSGTKVTVHTYGWDGFGNMTSYKNDGGGIADDALTVTMSYVADQSGQFSRFYRMKDKKIAGADAAKSLSAETYYYDGNSDGGAPLKAGLLTRSALSAGWLDGGETLDQSQIAISYERGDRGELKSVTDEATGIKMTQTYGFGGAVLTSQTNALNQNQTYTIDEQGRLITTTDPNGLKITQSYDAFNRVIKTEATSQDGQTKTLAKSSYATSQIPNYTKEEIYGDSGSVDETGYAVQNGFGNDLEAWMQNSSGDFIATRNVYDLRGLLTATSYPENKGRSFSVPTTATDIGKTLSQSYFDAVGNVRETIMDKSYGTGSQLIYLDSPRTEIKEDEEGYQTRLTYDALKRVIQVEQGKSSSFKTTANYKYDALNRLVRFQDGGGTYYTYSYDAAGRLRRVNHGRIAVSSGSGFSLPANDALSSPLKSATAKTSKSKASSASTTSSSSGVTSPETSWFTYEYQGMLKKKMLANNGDYAIWDHDGIGRVKTLTLSDSLPGSTGTIVYGYEYDGDWIGNLAKITDPTGVTEFEYDEYGREARVKHTYNASSSGQQAPEFYYDYNLRGQLITKTFPSGKILTAGFKYGVLDTLTLQSSSGTDYKLTYKYNDWGVIASVSSTLGHKFSYEYTTPLWPDTYLFKFGDTTYKNSFVWYKNGLLSKQTDSMETATSSGGKKSSSGKANIGASTGSGVLANRGSQGSSSSSAIISGMLMPGTQYEYTYDPLMQLQKIQSYSLLTANPVNGSNAPKTLESYAYDNAGNPTSMQDHTGAKWSYGASGVLNQISKRTSDKGGSESYKYDSVGRVSEWKQAKGTYTYYYDGLNRLRGVMLNGAWQMILHYSPEGELLATADGNPFEGSPYYTYNFRGWRYDEKTQTMTENENEFASSETTASTSAKRSWLFKNYDGHAMMTFDDAGTKLSSRKLGGYGAETSTSGSPWKLNAFHGTEDQGELLLMGQRHLMQKDGQWLQPEPKLYMVPDMNMLKLPLGLATYRYSANNPVSMYDPNGYYPAEVTVNGNEVTIVVSIYFKSDTINEWTPELKESVIKGIESSWSGQFGDLNVTTTVHDAWFYENWMGGPVEMSVWYHGPHETSDGEELGSADLKGDHSTLEVYQDMTPADIGLVAGHEMGHSLGIEHVEDIGNLMYAGKSDSIQTPSQTEIENIISGAEAAGTLTRTEEPQAVPEDETQP